MKKFVALSALAAACALAQAQTVNIICSVQAEWCNMIGTVYGKTTGTKVNISMKGSGEALAQLIAEKDNPKTDIWFGGTGDPHLQAAEQDLTLEYRSPSLSQLYPWAQQQAQQARYKTVFIRARWALATTLNCWPRKSCRCPKPGRTCSTRR
jgi:iron(III) transport system substrate-binding protein